MHQLRGGSVLGVAAGQPARAEGEALRQDQAQDAVLGGGGAAAAGAADGRGRLHVRGHLPRHHLAGLHPLRQHGHGRARPPVHPHDHGGLQALQDPQQDHRAHHQTLPDLPRGGADQRDAAEDPGLQIRHRQEGGG